MIEILAGVLVYAVATVWFIESNPPRNRFDGDNMGGNDIGLTPYDQQTPAERDKAGAWDVDMRGDE